MTAIVEEISTAAPPPDTANLGTVIALDSVSTSQVVDAYNDRQDAAARAAADLRATASGATGKREPPSWAKLEERATKAKLRLSGPIKSGSPMASAGLETDTSPRVRVASCQAYDKDGNAPEAQDRLLRAQLAAALSAYGC